MPFEPLQTDEPLTGPKERRKDFEAQLMAGCTTIGVVSLLTYFLTVWPFTVFADYKASELAMILLCGALPATVLGCLATLKFKLAGASGFFGGGMAGAVFMYLRLQQTALGYLEVKDLPRPDYPAAVAWGMPVGWFAVSGLMAYLFLRIAGHDS